MSDALPKGERRFVRKPAEPFLWTKLGLQNEANRNAAVPVVAVFHTNDCA